MQLFILGPAFGLPSIDAECNAAVALLQLRANDQYELVPTHSRTHPLPHLIDGTTRASGFHNIRRHLHAQRPSKENAPLQPPRRADASAVSSLIESRAPTLLDISLYVGFENFRLSTRPAYTKILPWYANYTLPSRRRAAARARTEHLGISSIDVDHVHEESGRGSSGLDVNMGKEQTFEAETKKRASLLLPRKETLRSLLQRPEHAAIFKLNALADAFFEPLRDMLGEHSFLGGAEEPTAVDCLAYGYLSLMLFPDVSQDWLAATMRNKYQSLVEYTERLHIRLSLATHVDQVVDLLYCGERGPKRVPDHASPLSLPWKAPTTTPVTTAVRGALGDLWDLLPVLGQRNKLQLWHSEQHPFLSRNLPALLAFTTASIAAATYLALHNGFLIWPHGHEMHIFGRKRLSDLGHAGAALAGVAFLGPYAGQG